MISQEEYTQSLESFMIKAGIVLALVVSVAVGCAATSKGPLPSHSAGDTRSVFDHAAEYWGKDKEVQYSSEKEPQVTVDENLQIQYSKGVANTVRAIREACIKKNEFKIVHKGVEERYGCLATKPLARGVDNVFNTGQ